MAQKIISSNITIMAVIVSDVDGRIETIQKPMSFTPFDINKPVTVLIDQECSDLGTEEHF